MGFVEGEGTQESPYLIYTASELDLLGKCPYELDKHYKLMANIDLSGVVYSSAVIPSFEGAFNGNGKTISNLTVNGWSYLGLFGRLKSGAKVRDLGVTDVNITGSSDIGGLAGENDDDVTGCYSTGTVTGGGSVGGLVGYCRYGSISTSYSTCMVTGSGNLGGLVGWNANSVIDMSYSTGKVTGTGGCVGGLVGFNSNGNITCSGSTGAVMSEDYAVGGLVGRNRDGEVTYCYSTSGVSGDRWVGGLVGDNDSSIVASYSTGAVTGNEIVGGLVGTTYDSITACYSTGKVIGETRVGGLVGSAAGDVVTQCFWDVQTSGQTESDGGAEKTTAEMHTAATFLDAGWDFVDETTNGTEDIWWIDEGKDYPRLWWELISEN